LIFEVSLETSVRARQAHIKNPNSTFNNRQSIPIRFIWPRRGACPLGRERSGNTGKPACGHDREGCQALATGCFFVGRHHAPACCVPRAQGPRRRPPETRAMVSAHAPACCVPRAQGPRRRLGATQVLIEVRRIKSVPPGRFSGRIRAGSSLQTIPRPHAPGASHAPITHIPVCPKIGIS